MKDFKNKIPKNKKMSPQEIANIIYPDKIKIDTEGRTFNRCSSTMARILRKTPGIIEIKNNLFIRIY